MCPASASVFAVNGLSSSLRGQTSLGQHVEGATMPAAGGASLVPEPPEFDDEPLYAARRKIYPQRVSGTFRRIKWAVLIVTLGIYYLLPFLRWDRGPNAPNQAVLIDL